MMSEERTKLLNETKKVLAARKEYLDSLSQSEINEMRAKEELRTSKVRMVIETLTSGCKSWVDGGGILLHQSGIAFAVDRDCTTVSSYGDNRLACCPLERHKIWVAYENWSLLSARRQ